MPSMMQLCNELGCVALGKGDYKQARKQFRFMVKESQKHGELEQAAALNRLGSVCIRDCRYEEAENSFQKSLLLCERIHGPSHPEVASELNNLAFVFWKGFNNTAKARPLFEKSVQLLLKAMPFASHFTKVQRLTFAKPFENLAGILEEVREYEAAEEQYRTALEIKIEAVGESSPDVFRSVYFLSNLFMKQGREMDFEELMDKFLPAVKQFAYTANDDELNSLLKLFDNNHCV